MRSSAVPHLALAAGQTPAGFERALTDLALAGAGWPTLVAQVAARTGTGCRLIGDRGEVLAASDGGTAGLGPADLARVLARPGPVAVRCADGWAAGAIRVAAGARRLGALLLGAPVTPAQVGIAEAAVTAVLIEAVRREAAGGPRRDDPDALVDALRQGGGQDPAEVSLAAARLGWDLSRPHAGAVLSYTGHQPRRWATAVAWLDRPVYREDDVVWTVLCGDVPRELTRIRARLEEVVGPARIRAASGRTVADPRDTPGSFRDAETLHRLLRDQPDGVELPYERAGLAQLLLAVPPERLSAFVDQHLGPIADRDDLLRTLECWLATSGSRQAVSERLHLHRNSVGYRVNLIKQMLGVDPLDPAAGAVLRTALAARRLLSAQADGGQPDGG
ncbi:PucR family transcriptional regulator [Micromonospora echinofusca]|uniref:PucR family transcriptional regulator n=1 Tax=Micromonospora echinofusca TaxID=47858 RepID=A0ABS3VX68_MICEH|nr:helix-turn-helix domain-containing protein [Micromonospora echinofusca]MBO4209136.1 PucR family transcriptional regulator [Micromonospora echinofusca]